MRKLLRYPLAALLLTLLAALAGCGGGGGGSSSPTAATAQITVAWPARSRAITGVSSAQSVVFTVKGGKPGGGDLSFGTNRQTAPAAYTTTYTTPAVALGNFTLIANFYAETNGGGAVVGTATTTIGVATSGTTIPTISAATSVASIVIAPSQSVATGQSATLTVSALDAKGNVVVVTPGSIFLTVASGGTSLSVNSSTGQVVASSTPGTATVVATIDGVSSPATAVSVVAPPATVSVKVDWPARSRDVAGLSSAQSLIIAIKGAGAGGGNLIFPTVNRATAPAAYTATYASPSTVPGGTYPLYATFYAQANGTGAVVGQALTSVTVSATGPTVVPISTTTNIASVVVAPSQTLQTGTSATLTVTAYDSKNNVIAVTPGSLFLTVASGGSSLSVNSSTGQVVASSTPGTATVVATIDGVASAATPVTVTPGPSTVSVAVTWPARSRAITGLSSAQSLIIAIRGGNPAGGNVIFSTVNRNAAPAAYAATYVSPTTVLSGTYPIYATFYAQANGTGAVVGQAVTMITVTANGSVVVPITTTTNIASVQIAPNQVINTGQSQALVVTAYDSKSNVLAVTPGSIYYAVKSGGASLSINSSTGQAVGSSTAGAATVTATIDGIASPVQTVTVAAPVFETKGFQNLYGTVRVRVHNVTSTSEVVAVKIGSATASSPVVEFTDATIPSGENATEGGAIDFTVPYPLAKGSNTLTITAAGATLATGTVTVSDPNPFAVVTIGELKTPSILSSGTNPLGNLVAELYQYPAPGAASTAAAPNTVANFVQLAQGTKTWDSDIVGAGGVSSSGATVTGVGTAFTTFFKVGDVISADAQDRTITAIASDTSLTINQAPVTAWAGVGYLKLTPAPNTPFYNGITFHRITSLAASGIAVAQFGDPLSKVLAPGNAAIGSGDPGFTIPYETNSLTNIAGAWAMARLGSDPNNPTGDPSGLNTASSQIFIDLAANPALDQAGNTYAVFGQTIEGLSLLQASNLITDTLASGTVPSAVAVINNVAITGKLDGP